MRVLIPFTPLQANAGMAEPAGTAVDPVLGHTIDVGGFTAAKVSRLLLWVNNTTASPKVVTVKAGTDNPPAWRNSFGDLTFTVPASSRAFIGPLESARYAQPGGRLSVDLAAGMTGTIAALLLPHAV